MSLRLGMLGHEADKVVEEVARVVRSGRGFGMVLDAEDGMIPEAEAFERLVVEVDVGDLGFGGVERIGIDGEAVIMRRDLDLIGELVDDGMIGPAMAEFHFVRLAAGRESEYLVAETDT